MLVNLTPDPQEIARRGTISAEHGFEYVPQSDPQWLQETGIYQCASEFNFSYPEFIEFSEHGRPSHEQSWQLFAPTYKKDQFGVADSIEQIKNYFKKEIKSKKDKYFIYVTPVWQNKENKGKGGGWRWHKWGTYIGNLKKEYEYLDDEDFGEDFKYVLCFSIVKVL